MTGTTTKVSKVEVIKPPITAIAIGLRTSEPAPILKAIGIIPAIIAIVVISIGRKRATPEFKITLKRGSYQTMFQRPSLIITHRSRNKI